MIFISTFCLFHFSIRSCFNNRFLSRSGSLNSIHGMSSWSLTFIFDAFIVEFYLRESKLFRAIVVFVQVLVTTMPLWINNNEMRLKWRNNDNDDMTTAVMMIVWFTLWPCRQLDYVVTMIDEWWTRNDLVGITHNILDNFLGRTAVVTG
jgi:hypothetical protein